MDRYLFYLLARMPATREDARINSFFLSDGHSSKMRSPIHICLAMCVRRITADVYVVHAVVVVCDDIMDHRIHRSRRFYGCSIGVYGRYCPRAQSSDEKGPAMS